MKVLIVEDDVNSAEVLKQSLAVNSHTVDVSGDGAEGLFMAKSYDYDAIVLDNSLPKKDGLSVCRELRSAGKNTPVLFASVDGEADTKMAAFKNGVDDYMVKPYSLAELNARLEAVARRGPASRPAVVAIDDLVLDSSRHLVERAGRRIHMTRKEFCMLECFMRRRGRLISRAELLEQVWTADGNPFSNTVEAHIRNVRKKISDGGRPNLIVNVPGRGYIMDSVVNLKHLKKA